MASDKWAILNVHCVAVLNCAAHGTKRLRQILRNGHQHLKRKQVHVSPRHLCQHAHDH